MQVASTHIIRSCDDTEVNRPGHDLRKAVAGSHTRESELCNVHLVCNEFSRHLNKGQASEGEHWYVDNHVSTQHALALVPACAYVHMCDHRHALHLLCIMRMCVMSVKLMCMCKRLCGRRHIGSSTSEF